MEYDNSRQNSFSCMAWDLHSFGVFSADMSLVLQNNTFLQPDSSTGYLEDAVTQWNNRCKRRRVMLYPDDEKTNDPHDNLIQSCWSLDSLEDPIASYTLLSGESSLNSSINSFIEQTPPSTTIGTREENSTPDQEHLSSSSSSSHKSLVTDFQREKTSPVSADPQPLYDQSPPPPPLFARSSKLAYPFELVKPGGVDGDVTLNDINARILRRPMRPVRHPIGEFVCRPCVAAGEGPGLSGRAVVALTRIHTQGRGTITIIRTRG